MLTNTFIHIQSIGAITEQRLWESGIRDWDSIDGDHPVPISPARRYLLGKGIEESKKHLANRNPSYFSNLLPSNQSWRLFPEFRDSTAYLDIETTGLDRQFNKITTIALYDGQAIKTYVQGQNLDDFAEDIQKYKVIVSYNGKSFDVPFIENYFNIRLGQAHIDLRYILYSLGFRGGLKGCERQLGMDRGDLKDIDGFFAVLLWDEYQRTGDQKVLDTLLAYNVQDTINLENLMVAAYNIKLKETPFYEKLLIAESPVPINPYSIDLATIDKIKNSPQYWQSQQWY
ncbi:ribonuclease H-like domain-containing protein [Thermodesulfobacteriota bacterium]